MTKTEPTAPPPQEEAGQHPNERNAAMNNEPITNIHLKLTGEDGNAFFILGRARQALRRARRSDLWEQFNKEATSGDYTNLLATCMKYFVVD
jgi:hypothetical protein